MSSIAGTAEWRRTGRRGLTDGQFAVLLPGLTAFSLVVLYPMIASISAGFFEQSLVLPGRSFVGLDNFADVLSGDFWTLVNTTLLSTIGATAVPLILRFALALVLNSGVRAVGFLRGIFLLPWVIPAVVYLATDSAAFVTGVDLPVDGGLTVLSPAALASPGLRTKWGLPAVQPPHPPPPKG